MLVVVYRKKGNRWKGVEEKARGGHHSVTVEFHVDTVECSKNMDEEGEEVEEALFKLSEQPSLFCDHSKKC